jgi:glycosyltransferase involved in cell wall biosynthesis
VSLHPLNVSVVIPNYNREALVGDTISNLLAQTLPPWEIIVVDDGSTDKSVEVIRSFGTKVKLIQQPNQGTGTARNAGLKIATGEFVQFQDSDDLYSKNKLEAQAKLLEQSGADIAFSPWVKLRIEGRSVSFENHVLQQKMPPARLSLPCWWLRGWSTVFQSLLFRRSFLKQVGWYRTDLLPSEDTEFFFRLLTSSPRVAFSAQPVTLYRVHSVNKITQDEGTSKAHRIIDWARCLKFMMERWDSCGLKPDAMTRLIFLAGARKHLRYLRAFPDAPAELVEYLSTRVAQASDLCLASVEWGFRLAEQARLRTSGSRWMAGYQAAPPSEHQLRLIRELGLHVAANA